MKKITALALSLFLVTFMIGCSDDDDPINTNGETSFSISHVMTIPLPADANPEIIRMIPGTDDKAVFVASATNQLYPVTYSKTNVALGTPADLDPGSSTSEMTSIDVSPKIGGVNYIGVCVAEADCQPGRALLVSYPALEVVASIEIGYNPDGCAFTKDGSFLVVACEDDREDRPCKPDDRWGGSVAIIDLRDGVANATLLQNFLVDWDVDSEPEHCETSDDGTVVVSVQETSQLIIFNVFDAPLEMSDIMIVDLPNDAGGNAPEPDGLYLTPDGNYVVSSNEKNGTFYMVDIASGAVLSKTTVEDDLTNPPFNIDTRKATKRTEPEECSVVTWGSKLYTVIACQESHAVVVYDITDPADPIFDSAGAVGLDPSADLAGGASEVGSEGCAAHPTNGVVLTANEREGSISLLIATGSK